MGFSLIEASLALLAVNAATFGLYWLDKRRARKAGERIPESVLLGFAFFGGSPAAYLAMWRFRHKTQKTSFRMRYWGVVAVQLMFIIYWATR